MASREHSTRARRRPRRYAARRGFPDTPLAGHDGGVDALLERISIDPRTCFGKPCIKGHRIWVALILGFLAEGTVEEILVEYPTLEEADVRACFAYGALLAGGHVADLA